MHIPWSTSSVAIDIAKAIDEAERREPVVADVSIMPSPETIVAQRLAALDNISGVLPPPGYPGIGKVDELDDRHAFHTQYVTKVCGAKHTLGRSRDNFESGVEAWVCDLSGDPSKHDMLEGRWWHSANDGQSRWMDAKK